MHGLRFCARDLNSVGLLAAAQLTNELDNVHIAVNVRGKNTEVPRWPGLLLQQGVPRDLIAALQQTAPDFRAAVQRSKRAAAATLWMSGEPMDRIELSLTQHLPQRGGVAGAVRGIADRTRDLLPAVGAVIKELAPDVPFERLVNRTMIRLELGLPAEIVYLVQALPIDLSRRQWLALLHAKVLTPAIALETPRKRLAEITGSDAVADRVLRAAGAAVESDVSTIDLPAPSE